MKGGKIMEGDLKSSNWLLSVRINFGSHNYVF